MRAAISLLMLLLSMGGAQTRGLQTESQSTGAPPAAAPVGVPALDVSAELKELRDMVVELRVMLRYAQDDVKGLEAKNVALKERLMRSEMKAEALEMANAAQDAELAAVKTILAAVETREENLNKVVKEAPKVAFSAGLADSIEAEYGDLNVVFREVITNVGQAYSSTTGFFTAPFRGVYYFRFTVMDCEESGSMLIEMHKNGKQLIWLEDEVTAGDYTYLSSGLTLQLEKGDEVNMVLSAGHRIVGFFNESTFSGFLLFPF
ncbi:multimerin-2-like [Engraulis encrasicolus]|uniref:multimerin-2-like n=1 Tax=Engraulis encrasicolus TaxID=184585 RepID=UPI002FD0731C